VEVKCNNKNPTEYGKTTLELAKEAGNNDLVKYMSNR